MQGAIRFFAPGVLSVIEKPWAIPLAFIGLTTPIFIALFHPPQLLFDSYDYMFRGFVLLADGSHPLGFGLLLRAVAGVSQWLWSGSFPVLFQTWQVGCAVITIAVLFRDGSPTGGVGSKAQRWMLFGWAVVTIWVFIPAAIFLLNGYVTEPTAFVLLGIGAAAFARAHEGGSRFAWVAFVAACLAGYYVRYQQVVLPAAALLVVVARYASRRIDRRTFVVHGAALLLVTTTVPLTQRILAEVLPQEEHGVKQPEVFLRKSIQCRLDCRVRLFETSCETAEGRKVIEGTSCVGMVHLLEDTLGRPYPERRGLLGTLLELRPRDLFEWLVRSPVDYLKERQPPFEALGYAYDRDVYFLSKAFPDVIRYYGRFISSDRNAASPSFQFVLDRLGKIYDAWILHWVAMLAFWGSVVGLFASRSVTAACLYATTLGTFFLFSYFQPQVSIRYLLHISMPAYLGLTHDVFVHRRATALTSPPTVPSPPEGPPAPPPRAA